MGQSDCTIPVPAQFGAMVFGPLCVHQYLQETCVPPWSMPKGNQHEVKAMAFDVGGFNDASGSFVGTPELSDSPQVLKKQACAHD